MSLDECVSLNRGLQKFLKGENDDVERAMGMIRKVSKIPMSIETLKETRIGVTMAKLRKHSNEKLASQAKELVKKWKSVASSPHSSEKSTASKKNQPSPTSTSSHSSSSPKESTPTATTSHKFMSATDPKFLPPNLSKPRAVARSKFKDILQDVDGDFVGAALEIELAMAKKFSMDLPAENKKDYVGKFRQLSFNLKKNRALRERLVHGEMMGEELIKLTSEELATAERKKQNEKLRDDAFQRSRLDWAEANEDKINKQCGIENPEGLFKCGRCKSTKTSNTQKQTRSADEPMTVFVHCRNCGNRWKC